MRAKRGIIIGSMMGRLNGGQTAVSAFLVVQIAYCAAVEAAGGGMGLAAAAATFSCGEGCTAQVEPWCDDSLRVRMFAGTAPLDDAAGALSVGACSSTHLTNMQSSATSITNGGIVASWADGKLTFSHSGGNEFLASAGKIVDAFTLADRIAPPPPSPTPKFACQDSCTLGTTGIRERTDADECVGLGKIHNVTRDACCAACVNNTRCVAWAWGRDSADLDHRHNCYPCASLAGTHHSDDRDFGCVERSNVDKLEVPVRTNYTYHAITGVFASDPDEIIVGLGQRSMAGNDGCKGGARCGQQKLNQKGYSWPLGMTKYQISVPWYVSSRHYGILWNHPGDGEFISSTNTTTWISEAQRQIDFWVTAPRATADPFASIMGRYADATGHSPLLPEGVMGFWQSKMRYRSSDELADVAVQFAKRNLPLDVLVIDFYSWSKFGDFHFDYRCWPNASDLVQIVRSVGNGTKILHSTYPWVDETSENYHEFAAANLFVLDAATGLPAKRSPAPGGYFLDPFIPKAREQVWEKVKAGYFASGIEMFWLDDTEPNVKTAGLEYACGIAEYCGALWPNRWIETFTDGLRQAGVESPVTLTRAGWAGMQTTGAVLWSSDIPSTFESLQVQVRAGLSTMMSGIPWWTTDVGGFSGADTSSALFRELIVRWYQYGCFCPIFRTHGDRSKPSMPPLPAVGTRWGENGSECTAPGGHASGGHNELWEFGDSTTPMLIKMVKLRESLKSYVMELAQNATTHGTPPMQPLFYAFPDDIKAWAADDQYLFGSRYLVAPVLEFGARNRSVYFPGGPSVRWIHLWSKTEHRGGDETILPAPLDEIPVFTRA